MSWPSHAGRRGPSSIWTGRHSACSDGCAGVVALLGGLVLAVPGQTPTPPPARLGGSGEEVRAEVLIAERGGPGCGLVGCFVPSSGRWF